MPHDVKCPHCGEEFRVASDGAIHEQKCRYCGKLFKLDQSGFTLGPHFNKSDKSAKSGDDRAGDTARNP